MIPCRLPRRSYLLVAIILYMGVCSAHDSADAYTIRYREELYRLYHQHATQNPLRVRENIYYLEQVLAADYANPLFALARVEDADEWRYYRGLFDMHIYLKFTELYVQWAAQYIKYNVYFFNAPWRDDNIASLQQAIALLEYGRQYWQQAREAAQEVSRLPAVFLTGVEYWHDQRYRIINNRLDYDEIINRHVERVERNIALFEAMDENTY